MNTDICKKSILVVAHPDDENLWFSSVLSSVDHVVLCYMGELVNPSFGDLRKQALSVYPLHDKMSCLELVSLGASQPRNFLDPKFCQYGIEFIDDEGISDKLKEQYKENAFLLRNKLAKILIGYENVVTHNPWGEYGHEEHVQVHRVIRELQRTMAFNLLFSNYCSTRTVHLVSQMARAAKVGTFPVDHTIARQLMEFYKNTNTWTWYEDWQWPAEETFFKETGSETDSVSGGSLLPVSMVVMPLLPPPRKAPGSFKQRVARRIMRQLGIDPAKLV